MAGSSIYLRGHIIFSTKNREPYISSEIGHRLVKYTGGIIRENKGKLLEANALPDHVHLYVSLRSEPSIAALLRLIKTNSSKWIKQAYPSMSYFEWQKGYGFFSVSPSQDKATIRYINRQEDHHRKRSFKEEFLNFLKKHDIEYDERYIWD